MANSCALPDPKKCGNMYFRSLWDFCTEYKVGDVVLHNGVLYLALVSHAGKDPKDNPEVWHCISGFKPPEPPSGRVILDGGYATTSSEESYYPRPVDGGGAGDRVNIPLI